MNAAKLCSTGGCLAWAQYWCVWGCYDQHISDAALCLNCMVAKKNKTSEMSPFTSRLHCHCGLWIREFFYTSVSDNKYTLMGDVK